MTYAIIGFGAVGQALARGFARAKTEVAAASTRPPEAMAAAARELGPEIRPAALDDALAADIILLAVPFRAHADIGRARGDWRGKTIIDTTNAYGVPDAELGHEPSSVVVARAFPGAAFAKAFNHLPAATLAEDPARGDMRRVIFVAGDDGAAVAAASGVVRLLGYGPVGLGSLREGGRLVQAVGPDGTAWAPLVFQDLFRPAP